jgi:hypothetical protein
MQVLAQISFDDVAASFVLLALLQRVAVPLAARIDPR